MPRKRLPTNSNTGADALQCAYKDMDRRYAMLNTLAQGSSQLTEEQREHIQANARAIAEEWLVDPQEDESIDDDYTI